MTDIGITVVLDGAYLSIPATPGNGQQGIASNDMAFTGNSISSVNISSLGTTLFEDAITYRNNGIVNLPIPTTTYYNLTANLTVGNTREYWTDITPSLTHSPSGAGAYVAGTLTILGSFPVTGDVPIPSVNLAVPGLGNPTLTKSITIYGRNFVSGATVTIGGIPATNVLVVNSNILTCLAPAETNSTVNIIITNPNLRDSGASGNGLFIYLPDPTVTFITPNSGIPGTAITDLHGTNFYPGATVTIGGDVATNVVYISSVQLTCTVPSGTVGAANVVVTNISGQNSGTSGNGLFTRIFSPSLLNLTNWLNGDFASLPWAGTASAGTSGSVNEITYGTGLDPTVGLVLNGHASAHYNGLTNGVNCQRSQLSEATIGNLITTASYTVSALIYMVNQPTYTATTAYDHAMIICSSQYWGVTFSTAGITVFHYTGAFPQVTVACGTGAWHLVDARYDGVNLSVRVDGGAWTTSAVSNVIFGGTPQTAVDPSYPYNGNAEFYLMERIVSKLQISDVDLNNHKAYINTRYGLSL